jgi:hypothetical protein
MPSATYTGAKDHATLDTPTVILSVSFFASGAGASASLLSAELLSEEPASDGADESAACGLEVDASSELDEPLSDPPLLEHAAVNNANAANTPTTLDASFTLVPLNADVRFTRVTPSLRL